MLRIAFLTLWLLSPSFTATPLAAQASPDSAVTVVRPALRGSWLADRRPFSIGDILTIVIDENTSASERASQVASAERGQEGASSFNLPVAGSGFNFGLDESSRDVGERRRGGQLVSVMSVRITAIDPSGTLRVEGNRRVTIDKRTQTISLTGFVRPEDVQSSNLIPSSRIADAAISYDGKNISPRKSILGKILSIFWP